MQMNSEMLHFIILDTFRFYMLIYSMFHYNELKQGMKKLKIFLTFHTLHKVSYVNLLLRDAMKAHCVKTILLIIKSL